jgi:hypothetical protein
MSQQATIEVTLPPAPAQAIPPGKRIVTIAGSVADGLQDVAVESVGPITIKAGIGATVSVAVVEVRSNGRQSLPASVAFVPQEHVDAVAADPAGFGIKVVVVAEVP